MVHTNEHIMRFTRRKGTEKKHGNIHTEVNGRLFDSKKEALRYRHLLTLVQIGAITDLTCQPTYILQEKGTYVDPIKRQTVKKYKCSANRPITYSPDFRYTTKTAINLPVGKILVRLDAGETVIEDVKGFKTDVYKIKRKMFLAKYPEYIFIES